MTGKSQSKDYLYGVPELLVLKILEKNEMYGYEIVQSIIEGSGNVFRFGEGVVYPLLHSMQKRRLLSVRTQKVNGRNRIYYRLTAAGKKRLVAKADEWQKVAGAIQQFLDGGFDGSTNVANT